MAVDLFCDQNSICSLYCMYCRIYSNFMFIYDNFICRYQLQTFNCHIGIKFRFYFHIIFFTNLIINYPTVSFQMGKFFMPKQKHRQPLLEETHPKPKTHRLDSNKTNKKDKTKHRHYKLQIYDELLALLRLKHLKYVSNTVKELRSLRQSDHPQKSNNIAQKETNLTKLKAIKKKDLRKLVLYIMKAIIKLDPTHLLQEESRKKQPKEVGKEVDNEVDNDQEGDNQMPKANNSLKDHEEKFINWVIASNMYKKKLQAFGAMLDIIQRKKNIAKEKNKERKIRKLKNKGQQKQNISNADSIEKIQEEDDLDDEAALQKIYERLETRNKKAENSKPQDKKSISSKKQTIKKIQSPSKPMKQDDKKPERTQFIKKGRNKFKEEKKNKKNKYKVQEPSSSKTSPKLTEKIPEKKILHPSWEAKKQQKKEMFIANKFQGKKIIL